MRTPRSEGSLGTGGRIGLIALGVLLGILAGEALARLVGFEFRPHMRNRVYFAEPDRLLGWRNRPGVAGPYGGDEFLTWVTINAAGQRGPLHPVERREPATRVAVLGDSQTWGDGVADDETYVALLDGGDVEMLSFACPGWGTDQQLLALDNDAARYAPDVVVIAAFIGNDLFDNLSHGTWQYPKPWYALDASGGLLLRGVPVPYSPVVHSGVEIYRATMRHSAFLNAIAEVSRNWGVVASAEARPKVDLSHSFYSATPTPRDLERFRMTTRLLIEAARHARAIGARPVVLIIPELWQVEVFNDRPWRARLRAIGADFRRPQRIFRAALRAEGVEVIDALPALARASREGWKPGRHTYYRQWRHLNARGHAVMARLLARRLGLTHRPWRGASHAAAAARPGPPPGSRADRSGDRTRSRS